MSISLAGRRLKLPLGGCGLCAEAILTMPRRRRTVMTVSRLLLDTTVLIDVSKDFGEVDSSLKALVATGMPLGVCAVSVAEFMAGVPAPHRLRWEQWIADFRYWDIPREAAVLAGELQYEQKRRGRALHTPDALMAAMAIITDSTLVTNNIKHFPMPNLKLLRLGG
ncbi:MAG TPA: PIN domain-containing protein, partial [Thermomicrobiales bacterium]|nr:PIN domain-containing protein [Thermomicrobiales bacterium]